MSLFGRLFGDKSSGSRQEGSQDSVDDLYKELAEAIARNATIYPPAEVIAKLLSQTGYKSIPEDRLRFGLSIANEVINIWLVNDCVPLPHRAKQIVDFAHHFFFEAQSRKDIWIGDFIINTAELSQIAREIEQASNGGVTNVQGIRTNWWGLMDMIYLSRQKIY